MKEVAWIQLCSKYLFFDDPETKTMTMVYADKDGDHEEVIKGVFRKAILSVIHEARRLKREVADLNFVIDDLLK